MQARKKAKTITERSISPLQSASPLKLQRCWSSAALHSIGHLDGTEPNQSLSVYGNIRSRVLFHYQCHQRYHHTEDRARCLQKLTFLHQLHKINFTKNTFSIKPRLHIKHRTSRVTLPSSAGTLSRPDFRSSVYCHREQAIQPWSCTTIPFDKSIAEDLHHSQHDTKPSNIVP